jgi:hypothetical protein|nr:MAG TPA: hypothetical protein [Caudoviricetes sp.]
MMAKLVVTRETKQIKGGISMNKKFIRTQDKSTATLLSNKGYQQVQNSNGIYVFLNTEKFRFSNDIDMKKIQFSNMLTF